MSIHCKTCGAAVGPESMDRPRGLARCPHCDTVVEIDLAQADPTVLRRRWEDRAPVVMPRHFELQYQGQDLMIRWRWVSGKTLMVAAITVFWGLFVVNVWVGLVTGQAPVAINGTHEVSWLHGLLHTSIFLAAAYTTAAYTLNTTTVRAAKNHLSVRHAPLPWLGSGTITGIRQLFSKERVHRSRHGYRSYSYQLHALLVGGKQRKVVSGLDEAPQVLWLEQAIEEHMGITDRPVGGEIPRR